MNINYKLNKFMYVIFNIFFIVCICKIQFLLECFNFFYLFVYLVNEKVYIKGEKEKQDVVEKEEYVIY